MFYAQIAPRLVQCYLDKKGYKKGVMNLLFVKEHLENANFGQRKLTCIKEASLYQGAVQERSIKCTLKHLASY